MVKRRAPPRCFAMTGPRMLIACNYFYIFSFHVFIVGRLTFFVIRVNMNVKTRRKIWL
jgi:hypothetical protein